MRIIEHMAKSQGSSKSGAHAKRGRPDHTQKRSGGRTTNSKPAGSTRAGSSASGRFLDQRSHAVVSRPSGASATARKVERAFAEGVGRALRQARAKGVAVTIQDREGKLVRGEVRERRGVFSIREVSSSSRTKDVRSTHKGESGPKR